MLIKRCEASPLVVCPSAPDWWCQQLRSPGSADEAPPPANITFKKKKETALNRYEVYQIGFLTITWQDLVTALFLIFLLCLNNYTPNVWPKPESFRRHSLSSEKQWNIRHFISEMDFSCKWNPTWRTWLSKSWISGESWALVSWFFSSAPGLLSTVPGSLRAESKEFWVDVWFRDVGFSGASAEEDAKVFQNAD